MGVLVILIAGVSGCSVSVAALKVAAPNTPAAQAVEAATSRGWRSGQSCRFWLLGVPFGLPQVDQAMDDAMRPVGGVFMRDVTVYSEHLVYVLYGWHCYRVHGEVFG